MNSLKKTAKDEKYEATIPAVRIKADTLKHLLKLAKKHKWSLSEIIRKAIEEFIERYGD